MPTPQQQLRDTAPKHLMPIVRGRIKHLTMYNKQGIDSQDFKQMFYRQFSEELCIEQLGYSRLLDFFTAINDIVVLDHPKGASGRFMIYPKPMQSSVDRSSLPKLANKTNVANKNTTER